MKHRLERRYGLGHLHFVTCSCYRRKPLLGTERARSLFLKILAEVRERYDFALIGYVVMPEHIHLLMGESRRGTPTTVMQVLKQRVSRALHGRRIEEAQAAGTSMFMGRRVAEERQPVLAASVLRLQRVELEEKEREAELHAFQSGEARAGQTSQGVVVEQLRVLLERDREWVSAESGLEAGQGGRQKRKTHPSEKRRVRHPLSLFEA